MNKKYKLAFIGVITVWVIGLISWYLHNSNIVILNPAGIIAAKERNLLFLTAGLSLIVIIPAYVMLFLFAIRYRETNPKAKMTYAPHLTGNIKLELLWWGIPSAIILLLSVVTWNTSHSLDPHRALTSSKQPLKIQVIALDWKWLFIYPDENVASINEVEFPVNTPVEFNITADAPMNSLWIPQLGSQIYAMPGMATKLNLMATKLGTYSGSSANVSGAGFSDMRFNAVSVTDSDYEMWLARAQSSSGTLSEGEYAKLVRPSENVPVRQYSSVSSNLFQNVLLKYMAPGGPQ